MKNFLTACGLLLVALACPLQAEAQAFPSKPIRILIPFAAGGPTDQLARVLAQKVGDSVGQPVVVDNRPGGGAQIAAALLKQAPADGYTLLIGDIGAFAVNPSLYTKLSYDPMTDFQAITNLLSTPMVLVVPQTSKSTSLAELVARGKSGPMSYASQGPGTGGHLLGQVLNGYTEGKLVHVPYKGSAPAMQDLLSGQVDLLFEVAPPVIGQAKTGKLRPLAVASDKRVPLLPDVPTTAELGFPDLRMNVWFGLVARSGTPDAVVQKLQAEFAAALASPDVVSRFSEQGFEVVSSTPTQFTAFMRSEASRWGAVVKATGAKVE